MRKLLILLASIAISADGKLLSHQVGALSEAAVNQLVQSLLNP